METFVIMIILGLGLLCLTIQKSLFKQITTSKKIVLFIRTFGIIIILFGLIAIFAISANIITFPLR